MAYTIHPDPMSRQEYRPSATVLSYQSVTSREPAHSHADVVANTIHPSPVEKSSGMSTTDAGAATSDEPKTPDHLADHDSDGDIDSYDADESGSDGEDSSSDGDDSDSDGSGDNNSSDDVFWTEPPKVEQFITSKANFELKKIPAPRWWEKKKEREEIDTVPAAEATALSFFSSRSGSPTRFRPARRMQRDLVNSKSVRKSHKENSAKATKRQRDSEVDHVSEDHSSKKHRPNPWFRSGRRPLRLSLQLRTLSTLLQHILLQPDLNPPRSFLLELNKNNMLTLTSSLPFQLGPRLV